MSHISYGNVNYITQFRHCELRPVFSFSKRRKICCANKLVFRETLGTLHAKTLRFRIKKFQIKTSVGA